MSISESNTDRTARLAALVTEADACIKHTKMAVAQFAQYSPESQADSSVETLARVVTDLAELVRKLTIEVQNIELGPAVSPVVAKTRR